MYAVNEIVMTVLRFCVLLKCIS